MRILAIVLFILLVSCIASPSSLLGCEAILDNAVVDVPFAKFDQEDPEVWITTHFPRATIASQLPYQYNWSANAKDYVLVVDPPYRYLARFANVAPTIGDILRCYGTPDFYTAEKIFLPDSNGVRMSMLYLERGLIFQHEEYGRFVKKRFNSATYMNNPIYVVPPGTPKEMMASYWTTDEQILGTALDKLRPWPESFTYIGITK